MADLDNEINANIINNAYSGSGHPKKDKLLDFLEEVASDINVLNAAIAATTASSDVTYLNKQWSDYIDIAAVGLNASASSLIAETSEMVAHIVTAQSDLKLTSDYVVKNASDLKLVSDLVVATASDLLVTSTLAKKAVSDLLVTSTLVKKTTSDLLVTSTLVKKTTSDLKLVSDLVITMNTVAPSQLTYLLSELKNAIPGLSASTMLAVASEIGQTVSNFNTMESQLAAGLFGVSASTLTASMSEICQTVSNFNVMESQLAAGLFGVSASTLKASLSEIMQTVSNLNVFESQLAAGLFGVSASTLTASTSEICQTISNFNVLESTLFAKINGATASSIVATVSVLAYTVSDVVYINDDLTNNVKSNITHIEGEISDLRGALAAAQTKFASDYAVMSDTATSDLWCTLSDVLTILSNYLISD